jgi:hypothetical protein
LQEKTNKKRKNKPIESVSLLWEKVDFFNKTNGVGWKVKKFNNKSE